MSLIDVLTLLKDPAILNMITLVLFIISIVLSYYCFRKTIKNNNSQQSLNATSNLLREMMILSFEGIDGRNDILEYKLKNLCSLIEFVEKLTETTITSEHKKILTNLKSLTTQHVCSTYKQPQSHDPTSSAFERLKRHIENQKLEGNENDRIKNDKLKKKPELEKLKETIDTFIGLENEGE